MEINIRNFVPKPKESPQIE